MNTYTARHAHAEAPEFIQRMNRAREFNIQLAFRRLLDRETYKGLRQYIRCPVDCAELERNARWSELRQAASAGTFRAHHIRMLRLMRENRGRAMFHVIARGGMPVEYVEATAEAQAGEK